MTGNERREKVLRSIFYPGAFSQDTKKKQRNEKVYVSKKKVGVWKKNDFFWKVLLCVWVEVVDLCIDHISSMTFSLHALLKSHNYTFYNDNKKYKWQIEYRSCKCSILCLVTCIKEAHTHKKTSHIIYVLLSRQRKDMNNSSNLHVFAGSYLPAICIYLLKHGLKLLAAKLFNLSLLRQSQHSSFTYAISDRYTFIYVYFHENHWFNSKYLDSFSLQRTCHCSTMHSGTKCLFLCEVFEKTFC